MDKPLLFQSFDDISDATQCAPRLAALRAELARRALDGFVVPHADAHQSEYLPPHAERLAWLTAFTGSAGAAVVLADKAAVFTDGRYTLQVRAQTDTGLFAPYDLIDEGPMVWIAQNLPRGAKLGYDPWLHTADAAQRLSHAAVRAGGALIAVPTNPIDAVWTDQPPPPATPCVPHAENLAGEKSATKRARLAERLRKKGLDAAVLTQADSVCWLLNIRGADCPHTPFTLAFAILNSDGTVDLYLDEKKRSPALSAHLGEDVRLGAPEDFVSGLDALKDKRVAVNPATAAAAIMDRLKQAGAHAVVRPDPCQLPKACKNPVEVEGMRKAHIRDGVAMARFLCWFEGAAAGGELTEIDAAKSLEGYRRATGCLSDLSFDSISAAGPHAALPHYRVTRSSNRHIAPGDIYLIDSGAQYPDGTTDITRTVIVGAPSAEMKDRFTRVLKGHMALATARFPAGTLGVHLDGFARRPLWEAGLDYDHGTGHGVGSYLSVHEGPQNISKRVVMQPLLPGMICSNEPGYYKEGGFGIRIENLVVVREDRTVPGGERKMMSLETITLAPIDLNLVEAGLLTEGERMWLNAYHARVLQTLRPLVDAQVRAWLTRATRAI